MAPSRGTGSGRGRGTAPTRKAETVSKRGTKKPTPSSPASEISHVYQSLLDETVAKDAAEHVDRPLKRRKVASYTRPSEREDSSPPLTSPGASKRGVTSFDSRPVASKVQTVEESSEDEASDLEFEDVNIDGPAGSEPESVDELEDLNIPIQIESSSSKQTVRARKKPATYAEKTHRLIVHKLHILCLLGHCMYVNGRCNNASVQKHLRPLLDSKAISYLNPKAHDTQFQRNRSFMDGLRQATDAFRAEFRVTTGGQTKPKWEVDGDATRSHDMPSPVDRADFIGAAKDLDGSQDTGNQLFCALLRAAGVDARLVCSLQVLPFTSMPKQSTPKKPHKTRLLAIADDTPRSDNDANDYAVQGSRRIGNVPAVRRRLGQPKFATEPKKAATNKKKPKPAPLLSFPVFWVEAFNEAQQKWIAVDPLVTQTTNKPSQLEPPASYELNQMLYVIAFEANGAARDVTKRYARAYNAKTRRQRVEASIEGTKWFKKAMRIFRMRGRVSDRDQVEDSELANKEAREGMPNNVQDFKDHPYYALERHMKRHEVIHPRREVGKVNAGTAANPRMEPVYRAQDVFVCKSADKWYRMGREVKEGEQPLKHIPARSRRQRSADDEDGDEESTLTGLYAPYQTRLYIPPPVHRGRIPKNVYGNLDIYAPSMVPAGAIHIRNEFAQKAAKLLRVDYADAVTGFKFQGRHGTAIIEGAVVAHDNRDAILAIIDGIEDDVAEAESKARSLAALRLWKRFTTGLRIAERVSMYADSTTTEVQIDEDAAECTSSSVEQFGQDDNPLRTAGQFSMLELTQSSKQAKHKKRKKNYHSNDEHSFEDDETADDVDASSAGQFNQQKSPADDFGSDVEGEGGFFQIGESHRGATADHEAEGGFIADHEAEGGFIADHKAEGGFIAEHETHLGGGGFVPRAQLSNFVPEGNSEGGFLPENTVSDHDEFFDEADAPAVTSTAIDITEQSIGNDKKTSERVGAIDTVEQMGNSLGSEEVAVKEAGHNESGSSTPLNQNDDSDNVSILSHDPEDDDAEPDWLESD